MTDQEKRRSRVFSIAKLSANLVTDIATHKAKSLLGFHQGEHSKSRLNHRIGQEIAQTLSEMKGPLMKVGQVFAQLKDILPPEISTALGQLRQYAKPIHIDTIRAQITKGLGQTPEALFAEFDPVPYRAASLGQVHKARLNSGEAVVVKVQYPSVAQDCQSDLKHLKTVFRLLPLIGVDKQALSLVFEEIDEVIQREIDYDQEVTAVNRFHDFFKDSTRVVVPRAFAEYSCKTVITMTFEQGNSLDSLHRIRAQGRGDLDLVAKVSDNLFECIAQQIFLLQQIHVDPHAGNFAVKPDGRLVMYDFGAVKILDAEIVTLFTRLVQAMLAADYNLIEALLVEKGIRRPGSKPLGKEFYQPWVELIRTPFLAKSFNFAEGKLHQQAMQLAKGHWRSYSNYFLPSRDTLLLDRVIMGHYWNFVHLAVDFSLRDALEKYIELPAAR